MPQIIQQLLQPKYCQPLFYIVLFVCSFGFMKDVSGIPSTWMPNDKVMHHLIFLTLMLLWQASYPKKTVLGTLLLVIYGGAVEIAQATFTNRMGDWWDWAADNSGIMLGLLLWKLLITPYFATESKLTK
ncbi:MAG: VanZ family protein [Gammaproteobacteria bacterium]|nr:VanZ family protein [Gammaproteobacteria bacterium]